MTRSPTDAWTAQQLREATPSGQTPKYLIRDHDRKFGACFARVANTSGIKMLITPSHTPRANAVCERFLGSVRRECLDHLFILQEKQLDRVLHAYVQYFNGVRPHQGIGQQIPEQYSKSGPHRQHKSLNNRAENSHQLTRQRERTMRYFKSPGHAQRFLSACGPICDHFRPKRHRLSAAKYRALMQERFQVWDEVTEVKTAA